MRSRPATGSDTRLRTPEPMAPSTTIHALWRRKRPLGPARGPPRPRAGTRPHAQHQRPAAAAGERVEHARSDAPSRSWTPPARRRRLRFLAGRRSKPASGSTSSDGIGGNTCSAAVSTTSPTSPKAPAGASLGELPAVDQRGSRGSSGAHARERRLAGPAVLGAERRAVARAGPHGRYAARLALRPLSTASAARAVAPVADHSPGGRQRRRCAGPPDAPRGTPEPTLCAAAVAGTARAASASRLSRAILTRRHLGSAVRRAGRPAPGRRGRRRGPQPSDRVVPRAPAGRSSSAAR